MVVGLVDRVTRRMRKAGRAGRTVTLRLRFDDYSRATRARTLPQATAATRPILATMRALLAEAAPTIARRGAHPRRGEREQSRRRQRASSSSFRSRIPSTAPSTPRSTRCATGSDPTAITRASLVGRDPGLSAWLMPGDGHDRRR